MFYSGSVCIEFLTDGGNKVSMLPLVQMAENLPQALAQASGNTKTAKPKHTIVLTNLLAK
jgi:hypothetical protein